MKLRSQFSLFASLLVVIVILSVSIVLFIFERRLLYKEMGDSHSVLVKNFATICEESIVLHDDLLLLNYIDVVKKTARGVKYAVFVNNNTQVITTKRDKYTKFLSGVSLPIPESPDTPLFQIYYGPHDEEVKDISQLVTFDNNIRGVARIGFSKSILDGIIEKAQISTRNRIFGIAGAAFFLGLLGSIVLASTMTRPIKKLAKGATSIGEGNLDTKIDVKSKNELGDLANEFNRMALKLKELDQMKNDFVSSVSHELRSPLTAIEGYVDFFLQGLNMADQGVSIPKEKQIKALNIMKSNSKRLSRFINDILDLAKIEAAQMEIVKESTQLKEIAEEMVTLFTPLAQEKKITLSYTAEDGMGPLPVDGDKIKQILSNLISNALKFTKENGKITVGLKDQKDAQLMSVRDTGMGIPKDSIKTIFDKFRQVKGVREEIKGAKGTGLGLAIVKGIVEAHGGKIWVESEIGKGSTFFMKLPKR